MLAEEARLSEAQEALYQVRNAISVKEQGIEHTAQKLTELSARKQKDLMEIELIRAKHVDGIRELQDLRTVTARLQVRIEELRQTVTQKRQEVEELKLRQQALYRDLDEKKIQYVDIASEKGKA